MDVTYQEIDFEGDARLVKVWGELDSAAAERTGKELDDFVAHQGGNVLLDITELSFLSSAGMRVLLIMAKHLHEHAGMLHIVGPNDRVRAVLTISDYVSLFPVHADMDEAVAALEEGGG